MTLTRLAFHIGKFFSPLCFPSISNVFREIKISFYSGILSTKFKSFGSSSKVGHFRLLIGANFISIGKDVKVASGAQFTAWANHKYNVEIIVGDGSEIGENAHITAINKILIGSGFLSGKYLLITDNSHGKSTIDDLELPPSKRDIMSKGPVLIGNNVWVGDKVSILPGVSIGEGAIVAANSVVTKSVPPYCVAAGNPAVVIKQLKCQ